MYMTLEYDPLGAGVDGPRMPIGLGVKLQDHDGPKFADITWDKDVAPMRVDEETYMISTEAAVNGCSGMAAFVMQGAKLLSIRLNCCGPVEIRSVKFSQSPGTPGFALDGVPKVMPSEDAQDYFDRNGLFTESSDRTGGMYAIWFDPDVTWDAIRGFMRKHPVESLGIFASAALLDGRKQPVQSLCYLFADPDHLAHDLSHWRSDDRYADGS